MKATRTASILAVLGAVALASPVSLGGSHTWDVVELFTNSDGTIQFIELRETGGGAGEIGVGGHQMTSAAKSFTIPGNVASPTSFKSILFGTPAYAALPGVPPPDFTMPVSFFSFTADTVSYVPWDSTTYTAGQLPSDGNRSLNKNAAGQLSQGSSSPKNYAGTTGTVYLGSAPAIPDGSGGSQ